MLVEVPCYHPLKGYYKSDGRITFQRGASVTGVGFAIPCGQCIGCRLEKSRQWALRCYHEAKFHADNCFITLTYEDDYLPSGGTLVKRDLQLFMKRLRKSKGAGIRFYACGEYGEQNGRPHYHALLFGCDFGDRVRHSVNGRGEVLYSSEELRELWPAGLNTIGEVTFDSAAYVARYCLKKVTGPNADEHYQVYDADGVVYDRLPEFTVMSRRPGIGRPYYDKYGVEVRAHDNVVVNRLYVKPPRYYDTITEKILGEIDFKKLKLLRKRTAFKYKADNTPERRRVREKVTYLTLEKKERNL